MIERIHLSILRAVHEHGSLTAAAEKLHLTQPALSHSIKKLESQIETPLWRKDGRAIRLTQAGEHLLQESQRLLPQLERLDSTLNAYAKSELGDLRLGLECHPCYRWLLKIVDQFLKQHDGVDIDVKQRFQFGGMAALFNHDIDLLITPDPLDLGGAFFTPVFDYEQVLVVDSEHRLAKKNYVMPQNLLEETLYTYPVDKERLDIFNAFLTPARVLPKKHKTAEATEIILQLVANGRGVATLPRWLVLEYAKEMPLKTVKLGKTGLHKSIYIGRRSDYLSTALEESFIETAKSCA